MHHKITPIAAATIICTTLFHSSVAQAKAGKVFVRPVLGLSLLSNTSAKSESVGTEDGDVQISTSNGLSAGLGLGYQISDAFAVEIFWEYRTNDSKTTLADGSVYSEGNYASNIFFGNAHYRFVNSTLWTPYLGAGIGWVQEIDLDLETPDNELSYSGDSDATLQIFAGIDYMIYPQLSMSAEVRHQRVSSVQLTAENSSNGSFNGLDYNPLSLQLCLTWRF